MADPKKTLLYFGSFNPIHNAHIAIAEYAVEHDLADEVVLVVSPMNPLKDPRELASEFHRFEMVELAVAGSKYPDRILVSLVEMTLPKPSYTIDTLRFLSQQFPETEFSLLMGGDIVEQLDKWKDYEQILDGYDVYVYPRPGEMIDKYRGRIKVLEDTPLFDISSTGIRERSCDGRDIADSVPKSVAAYIKKNGLWK